MSLTTTPRPISSSSSTFTVPDNNMGPSSDHWQVSQYFPLRPVGSAPRWSRAPGVSAQGATALNGGRALGRIDAAESRSVRAWFGP
jgi:hypothetical protein